MGTEINSKDGNFLYFYLIIKILVRKVKNWCIIFNKIFLVATHLHPHELRIDYCGYGCQNQCGSSAIADADVNIRNIPGFNCC